MVIHGPFYLVTLSFHRAFFQPQLKAISSVTSVFHLREWEKTEREKKKTKSFYFKKLTYNLHVASIHISLSRFLSLMTIHRYNSGWASAWIIMICLRLWIWWFQLQKVQMEKLILGRNGAMVGSFCHRQWALLSTHVFYSINNWRTLFIFLKGSYFL